jgi:hypothetical protein
VAQDVLVSVFQTYLEPVPTPTGFTSREIVRRAIEFDKPPRVPDSFVDPLVSDFADVSYLPVFFSSSAFVPKGDLRFDEWGVGWRGPAGPGDTPT